MASGGARSSRPRTGERASRDRWLRFGVGAGLTALLVVVVGLSPVHKLLEGANSRGSGAIAVSRRATTSTARGTTTTVTPSVVTAPATTAAPTTTVPPLRVPGLGLLPQPVPTPVSLPPTNLAPVFSRIPTPNKVIFLGIDDGIVRDPAALDLLRQANIPFTMFLVKGQAEAGVDFFRQLQQVGGVVEAHTINHPDLTKVSAGQLQTEVCGTRDDFQTLFGHRPTLFRPPYGSYNDNVRAVAASCGFKAVVMWKASTNDGRFDLQEGPSLTPGDIVLMHFRADLVANLKQVFTVCKQQGFAIASLQDYLPG